MSDLKDRLALVTGASRGIGYFAALELARRGAHVIAAARTVGGLEELDDAIKAEGGTATLVPLDLTDHAAIDRLGASIDQRWGRLDMLLANAGMLGGLSPIPHIDPAVFEKVMNVNVTANFRLMRSLEPLLTASPSGRAVFITSGAARSCKPFWGAYATSKAALEGLARVWAHEHAHGKLRVNLVNPGAMRTAMRALAMPGEDPQILPHPSELAGDLAWLLGPDMQETGRVWDFPSQNWLD